MEVKEHFTKAKLLNLLEEMQIETETLEHKEVNDWNDE